MVDIIRKPMNEPVQILQAQVTSDKYAFSKPMLSFPNQDEV